jgi:hypothetical protein
VVPEVWDSDMPDFAGRKVIETGASSGTGLETAKAITAHGARVILAVRDEAKGRMTAALMPGPGTNKVRPLDLVSLDSVRAFAEAWAGSGIDLLINNAGMMVPPLSRTRDGFELQFGTNYLGHFAFTNLLLPYVAGNGRVVTVSSGAYNLGRIDFDDLSWERKRYCPWRAYGQSSWRICSLSPSCSVGCRSRVHRPVDGRQPRLRRNEPRDSRAQRPVPLRVDASQSLRPGRGRRRSHHPLRCDPGPAGQYVPRPGNGRRDIRSQSGLRKRQPTRRQPAVCGQ